MTGWWLQYGIDKKKCTDDDDKVDDGDENESHVYIISRIWTLMKALGA